MSKTNCDSAAFHGNSPSAPLAASVKSRIHNNHLGGKYVKYSGPQSQVLVNTRKKEIQQLLADVGLNSVLHPPQIQESLPDSTSVVDQKDDFLELFLDLEGMENGTGGDKKEEEPRYGTA